MSKQAGLETSKRPSAQWVSLILWALGILVLGLVALLLYTTPENKPSIWSHRMPGASNRELDGCLRNLERLVLAVKLFTHEQKKRPVTLSEVVGGDDPLLKAIPPCPVAGSDTYSAGYEIVELDAPLEDSLHPTQAFIIACKGSHHKASGVPQDYPRFDLRQGFLSAAE